MANDRNNVIQIPCGTEGHRIFLREQRPARSGPSKPVLYVHGFTFPSSTSVFWKMDGRSWADALNEAGYSVWGLDFVGFGGSSRYAQMADPTPPAGPALGRAWVAAEQIASAVAYVLTASQAARVSIVAHSRGTIPTGLFATRRPDLIERLVMFGPLARRNLKIMPYGLPADSSQLSPWRFVTAKEQYMRFIEDVPAGSPPVLLDRHFQPWTSAYVATDPTSRDRDPPSVKVPNGPAADVIDAWTGKLAYDPGAIAAPLLVVRGEWDSLCTNADAAWLIDATTKSPNKRDVILSKGTHLMLLEEGRLALHHATNEFLLGR